VETGREALRRPHHTGTCRGRGHGGLNLVHKAKGPRSHPHSGFGPSGTGIPQAKVPRKNARNLGAPAIPRGQMRQRTKMRDGGTLLEGPRWHEGRWWVSDFIYTRRGQRSS